MCTGFIYNGKKSFFAYNLAISENDFDYKLVHNDDLFSVVIKVGSTSYYTHGINKCGSYGVLPFMNDSTPFQNRNYKRIDLIVNDLIKAKTTIEEIEMLKEISNVQNGSLHAIVGNGKKQYLIEPGLGMKQIDRFQVIANYPLLKECKDNSIYYGKDRYKVIYDYLKDKTNREYKELTIEEAFSLLERVSQPSPYETKLTFVYSIDENIVYYCLNKDFKNIQIHKFNN